MVAAKNDLGIEFPPRWNNSGARGFDRPSIAMGTGDSYDACKRVASVPFETGTDQQKRGGGKKAGRGVERCKWKFAAGKSSEEANLFFRIRLKINMQEKSSSFLLRYFSTVWFQLA